MNTLQLICAAMFLLTGMFQAAVTWAARMELDNRHIDHVRVLLRWAIRVMPVNMLIGLAMPIYQMSRVEAIKEHVEQLGIPESFEVAEERNETSQFNTVIEFKNGTILHWRRNAGPMFGAAERAGLSADRTEYNFGDCGCTTDSTAELPGRQRLAGL